MEGEMGENVEQNLKTDDARHGLLSPFDVVQRLQGSDVDAIEIRQLEVTKADKDARSTFFIASTDDVDRADDVVRQNWILGYYRQNPVILDNHNHMRVVGSASEVKVARSGDYAGKLTLRVLWDLDNPDPSIRSVGHQHVNQFRRAGSVGFRPTKTIRRDELPADHIHFSQGREIEYPWGGKGKIVGRYFDAPELHEHSSATVPMNPNAQQRHFYASLSGLDVEDLEGRTRAVGETVPRETAVELLEQVRRMAPEDLGQLVSLLWPDVVRRLTRDEQARKAIQIAASLAPASPALPVEPPAPLAELRVPDWLEGSPLRHLFDHHFTSKEG